jgi:hypothetical protein
MDGMQNHLQLLKDGLKYLSSCEVKVFHYNKYITPFVILFCHFWY